jgi:ribosomal protein L23
MSVLIKPIITEKMTADSELHNRYGFVVDPKANKIHDIPKLEFNTVKPMPLKRLLSMLLKVI